MTYMVLLDREDFIIENSSRDALAKEFVKQPPMPHFVKTFEICKVIILVMNLSSGASLILCVRIVKKSAVNLEEQNPYYLSVRS